MTRRAAGLALFAAAALALPARARIGLSTTFIDVVVEGLSPGGVYSLRGLRGSSYAVKNRGDGPVEVALEVLVPAVLVPPYESVPDPSWVELSPARLSVEPGEVGVSEVLIRVPDDAKLVGRHFQATISARTLKTGLVGAGVTSRLRFSIGPGPETLSCELAPAELTLTKARTGVVYEALKAERRRLTVANRTDADLRLRLEAVPWGPVQAPGEGWETPADLSWVRLEPAALAVGAFGSSEVRLVLDRAPASLAGRRAAFLVQPRLPDGTPAGPPARVYVRFKPAPKGWRPWRR